jgi:feruloyl esterase
MIFLALASGCGSAWADATSCEALTKLNLPHTDIAGATLVAAGAFTPPPGGPGGGQNQTAVYENTPAFCRVTAVSQPTPDSEIKFEVWLPAENWDGRLAESGNGGYGSNISYNGLAESVTKGYAAAANNTGHEGNNEDFALGHPEKLIDWGYRAVHETTVAAKALIAAYYGSGPKYSYWSSCSTGGRQGWVAAEYYPEDFDGLVIGDPANPMTRLQAGSIWANLALNKDADSFIPPDKWSVIHQAVMAQCDAKDGLKDGLITDPRVCHFDVKALLCKQGDSTNCLSAPQIEALKKVVAGGKNPKTGQSIYPGYPLGTAMLPGPVAGQKPDTSAPTTFRLLFQDANWDFHAFNFDTDIARSDKLGNNVMNAVDPSKLKALFARGGKIILYHGWNDPAITPLISIELYNQAVAANGGLGKTSDEVRLFMVPGMNHCGGGEGPNVFDKLDPISEWVEKGHAPDRIVAAHTDANRQVDRTRPLCPYPKVAKYKGSGSIDQAANFACAAP